uniref:Enoyl-CoA hydratase n=1 Tax=Timema shepardi TaxID=629360 RepID=A0A7R9B5P1_TIMSH|nr:unnamed protein product [Timema shepardi]
MGPTKRFIKKPLVAAISGYAVAGGLELALLCDLRVVEETAIMGVFNRHFGVPLMDGGTVRLQSIVGLSRALDLILTGRAIKAKEAYEWGLANRVVACGTALGQAINLANSLVKFPQVCLQADRTSTYHTAFSSCNIADALLFEWENAKYVIQMVVRPAFLEGTSYQLLSVWQVVEASSPIHSHTDDLNRLGAISGHTYHGTGKFLALRSTHDNGTCKTTQRPTIDPPAGVNRQITCYTVTSSNRLLHHTCIQHGFHHSTTCVLLTHKLADLDSHQS